MSYIEENLMPGERIIHQAKLHWMALIDPLVSAAIGVAIALFGATALGFAIGLVPDLGPILIGAGLRWTWVEVAFLAIGGLWVLGATFSFLGAAIRMTTSEFGVTTRRVIIKTGAVQRRTTEILLEKVESINVNQSFWGRLLNYGTIVVTGTGVTLEAFTNIADPLEFRRQIQAQIFADNDSAPLNTN